MMLTIKKSRAISHRRGAAFVYVILVMTALFAFLGLAVDMARAEVAKSELRRVADAAARAAVSQIAVGTSAAQTAATSVASQNYVDGVPITLNLSDIIVGNWNSTTNTFTAGGTPSNAVEVYARRTTANGNPISLLFGKMIGVSTVDVWASSIAALVTVQTSTEYISSHGDPWLAGEPAGTLASMPDTDYDTPRANDTHPWKYDIANPSAVAAAVSSAGSSGTYTPPEDPSKVEWTDYAKDEPYGSPTEFQLDVTPGSVVQISVPVNSSNEANNQGFLDNGSANTYANGDMGGSYAYYSDDAANPTLPEGTTTTSGSEHGISNIIAPINSVIGVFMDQTGSTNGADNESTPSGTDYSATGATDYTTMEPQINQSFYVGDGQNSSGEQQTIVVPNNAYALFLGTMDGHEWSNNVGGFTATITQLQITTVQ
ncbi:MAG: TadG family pilus assembly protein [Tepidisphaeraceae bacterium]|jgi:Flp pilus assembly protein TadG